MLASVCCSLIMELPSDDDPDENALHTCAIDKNSEVDVSKLPVVKKRPSGNVTTIDNSFKVDVSRQSVVKKKPSGNVAVKKRVVVKGKQKTINTEKPGPEQGLSWRDFILAVPSVPMPIPADLPPAKHPSLQHCFWEVFSPPRVAPFIYMYGKSGIRSLDLATGWDLSNEQQLRSMQCDLSANRPRCALACPPCTQMSQLMASNWWRMARQKREDAATHGVFLLAVALYVQNFQVEHSNFYIFEHPKGSLAWQRPEVQDVPGELVDIDQCMFGLAAPDGRLMKKPTTIKTNIHSLAVALKSPGHICDGSHEHVTIEGAMDGVRLSNFASRYPPKLCDLFAKHVCALC